VPGDPRLVAVVPDGLPGRRPEGRKQSDAIVGGVAEILLRATKDPFEVASPLATLTRNLIANNSGNVIFHVAAHKILSTRGTTVTPDRLLVDPGEADRINERYDAYVIPLANAFRLSYQRRLDKTTQLISRLDIPVTVLGVGAQSGEGNFETERLRPIEGSVRAFVSAVLDRSPSIGVRGELTYDYLRGLGFRDVEVIGCPSMFFHGDQMAIEKRTPTLDTDAALAINVTPYVKRMAKVVTSHHARYPNLRYLAQDLHTLELLLCGDPDRGMPPGDPMPFHTSHPLFVENKIRFFTDLWPWIEALRTADFAFGSRIHGNIAALLAGTPSYVLAHDSRTLELARYFDIPHRLIADVKPDTDAAELYAEADYTALNRGHAARFAAFASFLSRHGLAHVFAESEDATWFDRRLAETKYGPAVDFPSGPRARAVRRLKRVELRVRRSGRSRWNRMASAHRDRVATTAGGQATTSDDPIETARD
jgi:Polysaccharide pyruvyl transferase